MMTTRPRRHWHEMTTKEFSTLDPATTIAVLPLGAVEQHGPHLPIMVDTAVTEAVVRRALDLVPESLAVTVLPTIPVGKSNEHLAFPGTLSLSAETVIRLWMEVGESVARTGVRKLVLVNSHGGQQQILDIVARDLRARRRMLVVAVTLSHLGYPEGLFPEDELRHGIHAGAIETSLMLFLRPDLVHQAERRRFDTLSVDLERDFRFVRPTGPVRFGWQAQDLHPEGACGDATNADAERGRLLVEYAARRLADILQEVDRLPLEILTDRT